MNRIFRSAIAGIALLTTVLGLTACSTLGGNNPVQHPHGGITSDRRTTLPSCAEGSVTPVAEPSHLLATLTVAPAGNGSDYLRTHEFGVASKYGVSITSADRRALQNGLSTCPRA